MNNKRIKYKIYNFLIKSPIEFKVANCSFEEAFKKCSGYDCDEIFEKSSKAALNVKNGLAKYERDGVEFYDLNYYYELLFLIEKNIIEDGYSNVLDYGGGFGSMYYQHINILKNQKIKWYVFEQQRFLEFGHNNLENDQIQFINDLNSISGINLILFGSVLQYINNYLDIVNEAIKKEARYILVDRTPFAKLNNNIVLIEKVHKPIYEASYPLYVFDRDNFISLFEAKGYKLIDCWSPITGGTYFANKIEINFDSLLFEYCS